MKSVKWNQTSNKYQDILGGHYLHTSNIIKFKVRKSPKDIGNTQSQPILKLMKMTKWLKHEPLQKYVKIS